jgi:hypothetical protein
MVKRKIDHVAAVITLVSVLAAPRVARAEETTETSWLVSTPQPVDLSLRLASRDIDKTFSRSPLALVPRGPEEIKLSRGGIIAIVIGGVIAVTLGVIVIAKPPH